MAKPVHYRLGQFPPQNIDWVQLIPLIGSANAAVARYDGSLAAVVDPSVMMSPLTTQEAVLSSRIEGTQATMAEVLEYEAVGDTSDLSPQKKGDINEIINYRKALRHAEHLLKKLPLCIRVIREAHSVLLTGVRGTGKSPGQLRKTPNWIGPDGCTIETATYVPVSADNLPGALGAWEKYIHAEAPDRLVQMAVIHAEFEALHPFLDGNGRLGRMIIPLFMNQVELIRSPMFYISSYLEENREEYYRRLLAINRDGDWTGWCRFFLTAVKTQAEENLGKTMKILDLYNTLKKEMAEITRSPYASHAQDWIFSKPIFKSSDFSRSGKIPFAVASRLLSALRKDGVITVLEASSGTKSAILSFPRLLNIVEGRKVFKE